MATSHSDEATDDLESPYLRCRTQSGTIIVQGTATQELRNAVADLIRSNGYPKVELIPPNSFPPAPLNISYSEMNGVWEYSFELGASEPAFDAFGNSGRLTFKVGDAIVREEFKAGLENVARFQAICKRGK